MDLFIYIIISNTLCRVEEDPEKFLTYVLSFIQFHRAVSGPTDLGKTVIKFAIVLGISFNLLDFQKKKYS